MPTPSPGQKRVPRWRTMISPPLTRCPAKTLTPSMFGFDSRPLRLDPRPFLCAIGALLFVSFLRRRFPGRRFAQFERGDLELGQLGAMAGAPPVALLGLVFEDLDLLAAQVLRHGRLDLDFLELLGAGDDLFVAEHTRPPGDLLALFGAESIDEQGGALLDLVLLTAALYDCVRVHSSLALSGARPT